MKVKELIALLKQVDGERQIYAANDAEQNMISPVLEVTETIYAEDKSVLVIVPSDGNFLEMEM